MIRFWFHRRQHATGALGVAVAVAALAGAAPAPAQQVDVAASELAFVVRMMGVPVEGRFTRWDATLQFDPRRAAAAQLALRIDATSATFAAAEVSAEARRASWFDSARFGEARFQSSRVAPLGGDRFDVTGQLTLKGRTRTLAVPVTLEQTGSRGVARGSFTLPRLDYGIGEGEWADASLVAHEVTVRFRVALDGLAPAAGTP